MKKMHKVLLFVLSLIGIVISVMALSLVCPIPFVTDTVRWYYAVWPWMHDIFVGFGACICVLFFLLMLLSLFLPNKSGNLTFLKTKGSLLFSRQTLESTVLYSFADVEGINSSKVRAKINRKPENTKIYVKLSLSDSGKLVELTEQVQEKIESALLASLEIVPKSINIKVVEFNPEHKALTQKDIHTDTAKESRVE